MGKKSETPQEFWTDERCFITEFLNTADLPDVSVAKTRVLPGITTELHTLSVAEWYIIESGQGQMRVGNEPSYAVGPHDTVKIPAGCDQQITNTGDEDLLFLCVCVPRFTPDCYTSLE